MHRGIHPVLVKLTVPGIHGRLGVVYRCALKNISLILLAVLLFTGCSLLRFPGYHRQPDHQGTSPASWFQADTGHFLFNTRIHLMKNHFSGLMVIKPEPVSYRMVFITEIGLKLMDLELFHDGQVKVHYILEAMDRKTLIRTLGRDMNLVLVNGFSDRPPTVLQQQGSPDIIYRYRAGWRQYYYYLNDPVARPYLCKQTTWITNKVRANLYGNPVSGIDSVRIIHHNLRLSIRLNRINDNNYVAE